MFAPAAAWYRFENALDLGPAVLEADPAMVAVTPPNFGQGLRGVVTMYDVVLDLFVRDFGWKVPPNLEFWRDIFPIFERLCGLAGVNSGAFVLFGPGSPSNFLDSLLLAQLADSSSSSAGFRQKMFQWFRPPHPTTKEKADLPPAYGDLFGDFDDQPGADLSVTALQYDRLKRWSEGSFIVNPAGQTTPAFAVCDMDSPDNVGVIGGDFLHHRPVDGVSVDAKTGGFPLGRSVRVLEGASRICVGAGDFRREIVFSRTADACNAQRRMDGAADDPIEIRHNAPLPRQAISRDGWAAPVRLP
jgi:hypothetical protein